MCGICGSYRFDPRAAEIDRARILRSRDAMAARGPDGAGEWFSDDGAVALGHRRLAILDLSAAGAQPMASPDGRFRLVFNGEIYNFRELRAALERDGERFATQSDTEVLLALWARHGERTLPLLRGMYAFALWDARERALTLARDPFGIKPLYYAEGDGVVRFASQVRALEAAGVSREVDPAGLAGFLLWGSVPEPRTIRRAIRALPAGHLAVFRSTGPEAPRALADPAPLAAERPAAALEASVAAHLVSDVPVAIFLSSGLDSALVAALARRAASRPPPVAFTLSFEGWEGSARDEGPLAAAVARALGLPHVERKLSRAEVEAAWPAALVAMDQPSIDGFNTFLVARAAHEAGIKVALSGLGGDELLGGYPSFRDVPRWQSRAKNLRRVPGVARGWSTLTRRFARHRPKSRGFLAYGPTLAGAYFLRRGLFLPDELPGLLGRERALAGLGELDPVAHAQRALDASPPPFHGPFDAPPGDSWDQVQRLETALYMRNQLLRDSDWAAMASSVELRVPLVDVRLWTAMAAARFEPAKSRGKAALVRDVAPELPAALWNRPKSGFAVPEIGRAAAASNGSASRRLALRLIEAWQS
jgi:asparagine synthase (glutamine-hydrolysing)